MLDEEFKKQRARTVRDLAPLLLTCNSQAAAPQSDKSLWLHNLAGRASFDDPIEASTERGLPTRAKRSPTSPRRSQGRTRHAVVATAAETLTYAAERGIAWMFMARIGIMRALDRNEVRQSKPAAKQHIWEKRKLKRDE
jgi:hypothetical protein